MNNDLILLGHGSGGKLSHQLLDELIIPALSGESKGCNDAALLDFAGGRLAYTTDSYVVDPVFFPGGNIGDLAVNGTVNDLAMMGAKPLWLSVGLILEEGFSKKELAEILTSMRQAADKAGVSIVPATPRWYHEARLTGSSSIPPASALSSISTALAVQKPSLATA